MENRDLIIVKGIISQFITDLHKEEKRLISELEATTNKEETNKKIIALQRIYNTLEVAENLQ